MERVGVSTLERPARATLMAKRPVHLEPQIPPECYLKHDDCRESEPLRRSCRRDYESMLENIASGDVIRYLRADGTVMRGKVLYVTQVYIPKLRGVFGAIHIEPYSHRSLRMRLFPTLTDLVLDVEEEDATDGDAPPGSSS